MISGEKQVFERGYSATVFVKFPGAASGKDAVCSV